MFGNVMLDYHTVDMIGLKVDCEVLGELVRSVFNLYAFVCFYCGNY